MSPAHFRISRYLQSLVGERHPERSPRALKKTAHYLATQFAKSGWNVSHQSFSALGETYRNIVAVKTPSRCLRGAYSSPLLIGAHYDTVPDSPGADDNASGLAVLLEMAARLRKFAFSRPVWLVGFCLEEQDRLGSRALAARLKADGQALAGVIILECVGFSSNRPASQQVPPGVPQAVPTVGDFLAIVGNETARDLVQAIERSATSRAPALKTQSLIVPGCGEVLPHTRRSDHASFWDANYPAVMLTDTANFRNPHYHRETDTVETLNVRFLVGVIDTVTAVTAELAGVR
ncbi:MAG TPA: M20/M25/M40 family metallo-hydrolase [Nitrospiraceae bacterium]|nr:M20/M25/M40 family metallo-hydrolase [Nitrospiraceae bacterium]